MILGYLDKNEKNISVAKQRGLIGYHDADNAPAVDMFLENKDISVSTKQLKISILMTKRQKAEDFDISQGDLYAFLKAYPEMKPHVRRMGDA